MKILHLADLHLGKIVLGLSMIEDQKKVLDDAIILCKKENIKNIIISGDVFDRSIPPEEAVSLFNEFINKVIKNEKIKIFLISGNHDSRERLGFLNEIVKDNGLFIDTKINKDLTLPKHVIEEEDLKVNLYSLPYIYPAEIRVLSKDESIKNFEDSLKKVIICNEFDKNSINILNTHYFVTDNGTAILSDSETRTSVGTIEQVPSSLFEQFDYVALGHLHCPQKVKKETIRYAGSPLRYSVDEIKQNKEFIVIDIKSKENIKILHFPIEPLRDFVCLKGTVDNLTQHSDIQDKRIAYFELEDKTIVLNAAGRLKEKYPNYVGLKYINLDDEKTHIINSHEVEDIEDLPVDVQFNDFYEFVSSISLDDIQKRCLDHVLQDLKKEEH